MKNHIEANCCFLHKEKRHSNWKSPEKLKNKVLLLEEELKKAKSQQEDNSQALICTDNGLVFSQDDSDMLDQPEDIIQSPQVCKYPIYNLTYKLYKPIYTYTPYIYTITNQDVLDSQASYIGYNRLNTIIVDSIAFNHVFLKILLL